MKYATLAKQECHEQAANSPVPVFKRMNGFKLGMGYRAMDQDWELLLFMQKVFEVVEGIKHLGDRLRHHPAVRQSQADRNGVVDDSGGQAVRVRCLPSRAGVGSPPS